MNVNLLLQRCTPVLRFYVEKVRLRNVAWNYNDIGSVLVAVMAHLGQFFDKLGSIFALTKRVVF